MKTVLLAVDFTSEDQAVLDAISEVAEPGHARLVAVHVEPPTPAFASYEATGPVSVREAQLQQVLTNHERLERLTAALRAAGYEATARQVDGPTAERIIEIAEEEDAALIVLGASRHGAVTRTLAGSTTRSMLRHSTRPVVFVPPPQQDDSPVKPQ
jgi:nucleotide-binding universal stress UspA family protein